MQAVTSILRPVWKAGKDSIFTAVAGSTLQATVQQFLDKVIHLG